MDFSDTPAAKARTDRPQLRDFVGCAMRIQAGERKRSQTGDYYYDLTFDVRNGEGKLERFSARSSAYAIMSQLGRITLLGGKLDPQYLPLDARLIMVEKSLRFASLKGDRPGETPQAAQAETPDPAPENVD